jgi:hypothetical protein
LKPILSIIICMRLFHQAAKLLRPLSRTIQAQALEGGVQVATAQRRAPRGQHGALFLMECLQGLRCGRFSFGINTCVWSYRLGDVIIDT